MNAPEPLRSHSDREGATNWVFAAWCEPKYSLATAQLRLLDGLHDTSRVLLRARRIHARESLRAGAGDNGSR